MEREELLKRFTSHPINDQQTRNINVIKNQALELAQKIDSSMPDCREKSSAIAKLEMAVFHATSGISREDK